MNLECMFHADDFGLNSACCEAILKSLEQGRLQSLSLMPTGEEQSYNQALLRYSNARFSVHLNLLEGRALTQGGHKFGLTTKDGFFHLNLFKLLFMLSYSFQKEEMKEWIFQEFCAQIQAIQTIFPNRPVRLDGHLHIHVLPPLHKVMARIISDFPVVYVRTPIELAYSYQGGWKDKTKGRLRRQLLSHWAKPLERLLNKNNIAHAAYFIGSTASCALNAMHVENALTAIRTKQPDAHGLVEIMMHPVVNKVEVSEFYKDSQYKKAHITPERIAEFDFLLSKEFYQIIDQKGIDLLVK